MGNDINLSLVKALGAVPALASLDDRAALRVVGASMNLLWKAGSRIFEAGTAAEGLYIVLSGKVHIIDERADGVVVAELGAGEFFGELSMLLDTVHKRSAVAIEETELLVLPRESFKRLLEEDEEFGSHIHDTVERRLPGGASTR
jgi:CRP-like cAMP-binding protein